jgi:hypothetical protein
VKSDILFQDNNTRGLFFRVADNLPALVQEMEKAAAQGSATAKKELVLYRKMLDLLNKSDLGKHF